MSFYGNITNTSRTHFQFDKIYANRWEMESNRSSDGIYAGRFVLVEYDSQLHMDSILRVNKKVIDDETFYLYNMSDGEPAAETLLTRGNINKDDLVYSSDLIENPEHGYYAQNCIFYKCVSDYAAGSTEPAVFVEVVNGAEEDNYVINYNIDKKKYNRGYDSTVWQKVYVNGAEHYLMVAELNTVIPVFALQPDAPTQAPVVPHFDTESTDLYYKLHYQPSWGMRVKSARIEAGPAFDEQGNSIEDSTVIYTTESPDLPYKSDETTVWTRNEYLHDQGKTVTLYWHPRDEVEGNFQPVDLPLSQWEFNNSLYYVLNENNEYEIAENYDSNIQYYKLVNYNTGEWTTEKPTKEEEVPAAIYYNKAGFSPETISIDENDDSIKIAPTGKSGHQYSRHNNSTTDMISQPDIQEISIALPSIGSSIAKLWNLVYGDEIQNNGLSRNLDIDWDSTAGLRLVKELEDEHGFSYEPDKMNTIAGAINSVHDLMGMIIDQPNVNMTDFARQAQDNRIYYHDGKYYRKKIKYDYEAVEFEYQYKYVGPIKESIFSLKDYFIFDGENYNKANIWEHNQEYYLYVKVVPDNMGYKPIAWKHFDDFPANTYYYGGPDVYNLETNDYLSHGTNYIITTDGKPLFEETVFDIYDKEKYYQLGPTEIIYYDENANEIIRRGNGYSNNNEYEIGREYYQITTGTIAEDDGMPYLPNLYYIYKDGKEIASDVSDSEILVNLKLCTDKNMNSDYIYYAIVIDDAGNMHIKKQQVYGLTKYHYYYSLVNPDIYLPCRENEDYLIQAEILKDEQIKFCVLNIDYHSTNFYLPNKYFIHDEDKKQYIRYSNEIPDETLTYYNINTNIDTMILDPMVYQYGINNIPYEGPYYYLDYTYYYQLDNQQYIVDMNLYPNPDRNYYIRENVLYVKEDKNKQYGMGSEWNPQITIVPDGVTLALRQEQPYMEELEGFARTLNTIHGLILQINKMLLINDEHTRDKKSVQGTINILNDIIAKFEIIAPGQVMMVDEYGRIHSTPINTDEWIRVIPNSDVKSPSIYINHQYPYVVPNTESDINLNDNDIDDYGKISLETSTLDGVGHVITRNTHTVELPHNFKFITVNKDNNNIIEANNHIANFNINGDNWINLTPDKDTDTITVTHEYPEEQEDTSSNIDLNNINNGTISLETNVHDATGHIVNKNTCTVEMPHNFKFISINGDQDNNNWVEADSHVAKFNLTNGDRWIDLSIHPENDTIKIYHVDAGGDTDTSYNTDDAPLFGDTFVVPTITKDKKGHITEITTHTVQLPTLKIVDDNVGNVLTNVSLTLTNRESSINLESSLLGNLTLGNYSIGTSTADINSNDTLSASLGKLELKLNNIISSVNTFTSSTFTTYQSTVEEITNGLNDRIQSIEDANYTQLISDLEARIKSLEDSNTTVTT